jgi:hypothetical protein
MFLRSLLARSAVFASIVASFTSAAPLGAQRADVIRGRVIAADSTPLRGAVITVVDTAAKLTKPARTDSTGSFTITFENGGGIYMVSAAMLGHAPQRRVVTRGADGTVPRVDFKLAPVAAQLGAVRSVGERPKAPRSDANGDFSIGGTTSYQNPSSGLSGDVTGDLSSIMATLPGISVTPNADGTLNISAFGVASDQNGLVLNGMSFGAQVPRDGFRLAVVSASYDPGRGGFAGVQQSLRMNPGTNTIGRSMHLTLDAPALQWTSNVASSLGTRYGQQIASGSVAGPIVVDKMFYATAYQFSRRASGLTSLTSADDAALLAMHVSPDSVRRLLEVVGTNGIPVRTSRVPGGRENTTASLALRFDFEPNVPPPQPGSFFQNNATFDDYYLEVGGTARDNGGAMIGPTSLPSSGGQLTHSDGWAQFTAAKYLPRSTLNETTISVNGARDRTDPYLSLPSASVLVGSTLTDGGVGLSTVRVGGTGSARATSHTWSTQLRNVTTYNTWNRHHSVALTLDAAFDGYSVTQDAGFGTFVFNSLADFAGGEPASYSRTLTGLHTSGTGFTGAVGLGDTYNVNAQGPVLLGQVPSARPTFQYGLRLEANRFGVRPAYNPAAESIFHVRTDHVPNGAHLMPMVGFSMPLFGQYKVNGIPFGWRGYLTGGVREYHGTLSTRAIDSYTRQTGLPSGIQQLYCVGPAAPAPDWRAFEGDPAAVPSECANGASSTPLAQTAPPVALFAPDYTLYDSWRPALNMSYTLSNMFRLTGNATLALNRNVPGSYDLNFAPVSRFTLPAEGNRPVYVSPASIVPSTGAVSFTGSRVSPDFAHVTEARSDLRSDVWTLGGSLSISPIRLFFAGPSSAFMFATLSYNYHDAREQFRAFQSAAGDPREIAWSRGSIAKHDVTVTLTRNQGTVGTVALQARMQSGIPFTPLVAGDINGDGYANDRAFVFDPSGATIDAGTAGAMRQLLRSAPSSARACLERQLGRVAGRNSCVGPWSMPQFNMTVSPDPYRFGFRNRGSVTLIVTNIAAGLDQALHGSNKLHGWGQPAFVDPTLLTVRGFDPTAQRFDYTVNPLFGSTSQFRSTFRAPFMLTLDVRLEVGPDRETQFLESLLRPRASEGPALTLEQIKNRIARGFNPIDQLLLQKDSIKLTAQQVDSIKQIGRHYAVRRDSIATDMARYLLSRHGEYGGAEVRERWHAAGVASYRGYISDVRAVVDLLTPEQRAMAETKPSVFGFVNLARIKDQDVSTIFRGAMSSLP